MARRTRKGRAAKLAIAALNRANLQELSRIRLREAKILLDERLYDGSYYLAGYSVECALKACIARRTKQFDFPDKKVVVSSHTHDLASLVKTAELGPELDKQIESSPSFGRNWAVVKDWNEQSRYRTTSARKAHDFYSAITGRRNGVMRWISLHW